MSDLGPGMQSRAQAPLYRQIQQLLREQILRGDVSATGRLPSESDLAEQYGVSRITARQAVLELVQEGLVVRYPGRGTFVRDQGVPEVHSGVLTGFSEEMLAAGRKPGAKVLSVQQTALDAVGAERMQMAPGSLVWRICRQRLADEQVVSYEITWWPQIIGAWLSSHDLTGALHDLVEHGWGVRLARAVESITARQPTSTERKWLELPGGIPVLYVDRVTFDESGAVNHWGCSAYRADRYSYRVLLHRGVAGQPDGSRNQEAGHARDGRPGN